MFGLSARFWTVMIFPHWGSMFPPYQMSTTLHRVEMKRPFAAVKEGSGERTRMLSLGERECVKEGKQWLETVEGPIKGRLICPVQMYQSTNNLCNL